MRINIRPTCGGQHGKSFAERAHPVDGRLHIRREVLLLCSASDSTLA